MNVMNNDSMKDSIKEKILLVAERLFASKGYDAVGVQEIVVESGVTKPTLYYYFECKQGVLEAIIEQKGTRLIQTTREISARYTGDFFHVVSDLIEAQIQFAEENPDFFRIHCALLNAPENSIPHEVYKHTAKALYEIIFNLFQKATSVFGNMKGKEELYSTLFFNNMTTLAMLYTQKKYKIDKDTLYQITHSILYGFAD